MLLPGSSALEARLVIKGPPLACAAKDSASLECWGVFSFTPSLELLG